MRLPRKVKLEFSFDSVLRTIPLLFLILLLAAVSTIDGFNLEQRLPLVKYGNANAYFGYSVATHVIGDPKNNTKCLLVGAPLDQNLQPNTTRSGALWRCPITQRTDDCEQVITDGRRSEGGSYEVNKTYDSEILSPPSSDEIKEEQWMGVTVRSQNYGKVVVCAHRYINTQFENRYGQGLCYVLTNDLEYDEVYEPCRGRSVAREHEDYALCQVGTSSAILEDETMVLGTPGPFTWRGTIFVTKIGGSFLERDKYMYHTEHSEARSPVDKYSYLGMSVTGGHYYDDNMAYAAGAPRSQGHGQVVIFQNQSRANPIPLAQIIDGEQFGSSFGYEIATADINGDRKPDLIVGAPLYFSKTEGGAVYIYQNENDMLPKRATLKLTGAPESRFGLALANIGDLNKDNCEDIAVGAPYEGDGVVYIYLGSPKGLIAEPAQKIQASELGGRGMSRPIKTFGISITGKTDLDDNSYPDVVIGAYNSSAAVVLLARPIISIRTTHGVNETRNIDPNRAGCRADVGSNLTCFSFEACCSIDPYDGQNKELSLLYSVEAETFDHQKKFSRVFFDRDNKRSNVVSRVVKVRTDGRTSCQMVTGYIKANTRDIQTPIGFRLKYTLVEDELAESALIRLNPILDQTRAQIDFEGTFQKDCGDDDLCESDLVIRAEPNITRSVDGYTWTMDETELEVRINVTNLADSAYEAQLFIEHQASVSYVATKKPTNATCNSFNTTLVACSLGNPMLRGSSTFVTIRFQPKGLEPKEKTMNFHIFANTTSKLVGKELPDQNLIVHVVRRAKLHFRGWAIPEQSFYSGAEKLTDSPMEMSDVGSPLIHSFSIFNEGPSTAPKVLMVIHWPLSLYNDPDEALKDRYLLYIEQRPNVEIGQGECTVASEYVNPLKLANKPQQDSAYLGAPASMMMRPSLQMQHFNRSQSHHQHHSNSLSRMPRNAIERVARLERLLDGREGSSSGGGGKGKKQDIIELDCNKGTAKCIRIECEIYNMAARSEAQVLVKARLWNSTLVTEYPRVDRVRIISTAHVKIPEDFGVEEMENNDIEVETRAYPELLNQQLDTSLPMWMIILAVVGGLVLLALFTYAMWRCGFFKRRRPTDPTLSGNLEKMNEEKPFLGAKNTHSVF